MLVRSLSIVATGVVLVLVTGCGAAMTAPPAGGSNGMSRGDGPACPPLPVVAAPPRRVVTMDGGAAAILERLGLADRVVGTAAPSFIQAFTGAERARLEAIPVIDPGQGNAEAVVAARPDLVMGISALSFGGFDGTPTVDRLRRAGAQALVGCRRGTDGPVTDLSPTLELIRQTAAVFGVPGRGEVLAGRIRADAAAAAPPAGATPVRVLQLAAAPVAGQPLATRGGQSVSNGVIALAGGQNVAADVPRDFATISAERVAALDPQAIVVVTGFSPLPDAELTVAIRSAPALAATTAVRENRFVAIPQSVLSSPSVLNGQAVAQLAAVLRAPAR